jgi:hypothetical protein
MPNVGEVYGLGPEDRWPHEMELDREGGNVLHYFSRIGGNEYLWSRE